MLHEIYSFLPPFVRVGVKQILRAQGHRKSMFDVYKAKHLSRTKKRLDVAAKLLSWRMSVAGVTSLRGKACLEIGAGYVLAEPVIFYLLGCGEAVATDFNKIASMAATVSSIRNTNRDDVMSALSGLDLPDDINDRLDKIFSADISTLMPLLSYRAPYDGSCGEALGKFDFIHSVSVLEHIPNDIVGPFLKNFVSQLSRQGVWINHVDLKDHRDFIKAPFGFLAEDTDWTEAQCDSRGNRLRKSQWAEAFAPLPAVTECVFEKDAGAELLPPQLSSRYQKFPRAELSLGEVMFVSRAP